MTETVTAARTRFGRRSQRGLMLGISAERVACAGVCVATLTAAVFVAGAEGVLIASPIWVPLIVLVFARRMGQPIIELLPTAAHFGIRVLLRQSAFRVLPSTPRPAGTMALPGDAAALRFIVSETAGTGTGPVFVHDPHAGTLTVVALVDHPAYVLLSPDEQVRRVTGWSRVLAGLAASTHVQRLQVLEMSAPDRGEGILGYWQQARVAHDDWSTAEYDSLLELFAPSASAHRTLISIAVSVPRGKTIRGRDALARGVEAARQEMSVLDSALRAADLHLSKWLGEQELAAVVRTAYDPASLNSQSARATLNTAGPVAIDEHWDHIRHDTGFSAVLWITEWPRIDVSADFLHALIFQAGVRKSLSIIATPLTSAEAMRDIRKAKVEHVTDAEQKAKIGTIADLSDAAELDDVIQRERALLRGHADLRFTGLITVTATSLDEMTDAVAQIERSAIQCGCETRRLVGQQARAFTAAALPLARRVN